MSDDGFCLLLTEQLSVESVFSSLCHWQITQKLVRNTVNTIRINSSENKQQPCASRSGSSKWEEAKLGSTVEKLQNSHSFPFPLKTSLNTYLRFSKYLELDNSSGLHDNEVYILCVHIWTHLVRNVLIFRTQRRLALSALVLAPAREYNIKTWCLWFCIICGPVYLSLLMSWQNKQKVETINRK